MEILKIISHSEAYNCKDKSGNIKCNGGGGKQASYNIPKALVNQLLEAHAIEVVNQANYGRTVWKLANNYILVLGEGIFSIIGSKYRNIEVNFYIAEGIGNNKWQMFKSIYNDAGGIRNKWFVDLYDTAVEGWVIRFKLDGVKKILFMDITRL